MRKIPATLVTQHPDNASVPYWLEKEFVSTSDEIEECFRSFTDFGATEYKWDWEGKLVDESVMEKIFSRYYEYFSKHQIGKEVFITFRIPNPKAETEYRIGRALMAIKTSSLLAKTIGYMHSPLFEVILPMTETAEDIIDIQDAYRELSGLKHPLFAHENDSLNHIELIPLVEEANKISQIDSILIKYLDLHKKKYKTLPEYMRPYVARSDPALNAGIVPTVLGIKIGLSKINDVEKKSGVKMYPIIGAGSLPFRGGLAPDRVDTFIEEYAGIRTTTIQSAFRYDHDFELAKNAIKALEDKLPSTQIRTVSNEEELKEIMDHFEMLYKRTVEKIANQVNKISEFIPSRRERVQHVGLFGYSRGVGSVKLPRAIKYTAALYSIGIPPELIGTGRGLRWAQSNGLINLIKKNYVNLKNDLSFAMKFVNRRNLDKLAKFDDVWLDVIKDVDFIEEYIGEENKIDEAHLKLTTKILDKINKGLNPKEEIVQASIIRKSLG